MPPGRQRAVRNHNRPARGWGARLKRGGQPGNKDRVCHMYHLRIHRCRSLFRPCAVQAAIGMRRHGIWRWQKMLMQKIRNKFHAMIACCFIQRPGSCYQLRGDAEYPSVVGQSVVEKSMRNMEVVRLLFWLKICEFPSEKVGQHSFGSYKMSCSGAPVCCCFHSDRKCCSDMQRTQ